MPCALPIDEYRARHDASTDPAVRADMRKAARARAKALGQPCPTWAAIRSTLRGGRPRREAVPMQQGIAPETVAKVSTGLEAWRAEAAGRIVRVRYCGITLIMHDAAGRWECTYPTLEAALAGIAEGVDWTKPERRPLSAKGKRRQGLGMSRA